MYISKVFRTLLVSATLSFVAFSAQGALFDDDEARRAILELRQKVDAQQQRNTDDLRKANDDNAQMRRSILDLSNQLETLRAELAKLRGQDEQLARDVAEI